MNFATEKQLSYILALSSEVQNESLRSLAEVRCIGLYPEDIGGAMTSTDAAQHIKNLKKMKKNISKVPMYQDPNQPFTNNFLAELWKQ